MDADTHAEQEAVASLHPKGQYAELDATERLAKLDPAQVSSAFATIGAGMSRAFTDLGATIMRAIRFAGEIQAKLNEARALGVTQEQINAATEETKADGEGLIPKLDRLIEAAITRGKERVQRKVLGVPEEHRERADELLAQLRDHPKASFPVPEAIGRLIEEGRLKGWSIAERPYPGLKGAPSFDQLVFGPYAVDNREETQVDENDEAIKQDGEAEAKAASWDALEANAPTLLFVYRDRGNTHRWELSHEGLPADAFTVKSPRDRIRNVILRELLTQALDELNAAEALRNTATGGRVTSVGGSAGWATHGSI